jgi:pimeloyl-ACP methyl ester carboxylesterase
MLPGLDGSGHLFEPFSNALPRDIPISVMGYPAAGPNAYADLLPLVRSGIPPGPFVLLGWSFSGPLALTLAAESPAGLRGVVLVASFASNPHPWATPFRFLISAGLVRLFPAASQVKALLGGYSSPDVRERLARAHASVGPQALAQRLRAVLGVDVRESLQRCQVPILYLASRRDQVVPKRVIRSMLRIAPAITVKVIDGPHMALITNPVQAAREVASFLRERCVSLETGA